MNILQISLPSWDSFSPDRLGSLALASFRLAVNSGHTASDHQSPRNDVHCQLIKGRPNQAGIGHSHSGQGPLPFCCFRLLAHVDPGALVSNIGLFQTGTGSTQLRGWSHETWARGSLANRRRRFTRFKFVLCDRILDLFLSILEHV